MTEAGVILGLDVGSVRIGVATVRTDVRFPQPLTVLQYHSGVIAEIAVMAKQYQALALVVGWPRGMQGQETAQTAFVTEFAEELRRQVVIPVHLQDEALTSQKAEQELRSRNKPYGKGDIDALAATYILDDYLQSNEVGEYV